MIILKLALVILLIIFLLRLKVGMGLSLISASVAIGLLFFSRKYDIPVVMAKSLSSYMTIKTAVIVYGVLLLSYLLKARQVDRMVAGLSHLFKNVKYAIIVPPMLIGLLPMPGGAMLPAPIIESMSGPLNLPPEKKTFINYWFRHIWEYFWPLYPGLILTASIMQTSIKSIMFHQFYLTILAFVTGMVFLSSVKNKTDKTVKPNALKGLISLAMSVSPILLMIILIMATPIREDVIVMSISLAYLLLQRTSFKEKFRSLWKSFSIDTMLLIVGVMVFKDFLNESSSLNAIVGSIPREGFAMYVMLIFIPLLIGFLTGINQAYVGIVLPILVAFISVNGIVDFSKLAIFYASGFTGVLLSPVHLCLSLTKEYFHAEWGKVYKILIPASMPILIIPILVHLIFKI